MTTQLTSAQVTLQPGGKWADLKLPLSTSNLVREKLRRIPGVSWNRSSKTFRVPRDVLNILGSSQDWKIPNFQNPINGACNLYPYQIEGVRKALENGNWIFNDEMGLGKSAQAITAARLRGAKTILVVCPALVRRNWVAEFDRWWPGHEEIGVIHAGLSRKQLSKATREELERAHECMFQVVSYNLLSEVSLSPWDTIFLDEVHRIKRHSTKTARAVKALVHANSSANVYALTATLLPNEPIDCWNVIDTLWPGRFGAAPAAKYVAPWIFCNRYTNREVNEYGTTWHGINELHADELRARLAQMSSRTTKHDVAHLLPPFMTTIMRTQTTDSLGTDEYGIPGGAKLADALEWTADALEGAPHVCILTHLKQSARDTAAALEAKHLCPVYCVTGETSPDARNELLAKAKASPKAVVVATMHSVGIGIDLTFCTQAAFLELYYRPETVIQAMGRFLRLSSKAPAAITFFVAEGTVDDKIMMILSDKIMQINKAIRGGLTEMELETCLTGDQEGWLDALCSAVTDRKEDTSYDDQD